MSTSSPTFCEPCTTLKKKFCAHLSIDPFRNGLFYSTHRTLLLQTVDKLCDKSNVLRIIQRRWRNSVKVQRSVAYLLTYATETDTWCCSEAANSTVFSDYLTDLMKNITWILSKPKKVWILLSTLVGYLILPEVAILGQDSAAEFWNPN